MSEQRTEDPRDVIYRIVERNRLFWGVITGTSATPLADLEKSLQRDPFNETDGTGSEAS